jgi:hypothetical protein
VVRAGQRAVLTVLRSFLVAALAGALVTLVLLASLKLAELPHTEPLVASDAAGATSERWLVEGKDRLAATGPGVEAWPRDISPLVDPELRGLSVTTMKVRNTAGTVIGVASRIVAIESADSTPRIWWSFVVGERGTLAAQITDASQPAAGRLLGGTRSFAGAAGAFVEQARADGGYEIRLVRGTVALQ